MSGTSNSGRKPLPTAHHQLTGSWRAKSREGEPAPVRHGDGLPMPEGMSEDAVRVWNWWHPMLWNNGTLSETEAVALRQLCESAVSWVDALGEERAADKDTKANARKEARAAGEYFLKLQREFGLTPISRTSIAAIKDGNDDAIEADRIT